MEDDLSKIAVVIPQESEKDERFRIFEIVATCEAYEEDEPETFRIVASCEAQALKLLADYFRDQIGLEETVLSIDSNPIDIIALNVIWEADRG